MAKARKLAVNTFIRSIVRDLVRVGNSRTQVSNNVNARFANLNQNQLANIIRVEQERQSRVDAIMNRDKRRNVDLARLVGCRGPNPTVTASLVIEFVDQQTGQQVRQQGLVTLANSGRLADILNTAINQIATAAVGRGYTPPTITSANTSGPNRFRLDYVECG